MQSRAIDELKRLAFSGDVQAIINFLKLVRENQVSITRDEGVELMNTLFNEINFTGYWDSRIESYLELALQAGIYEAAFYLGKHCHPGNKQLAAKYNRLACIKMPERYEDCIKFFRKMEGESIEFAVRYHHYMSIQNPEDNILIKFKDYLNDAYEMISNDDLIDDAKRNRLLEEIHLGYIEKALQCDNYDEFIALLNKVPTSSIHHAEACLTKLAEMFMSVIESEKWQLTPQQLLSQINEVYELGSFALRQELNKLLLLMSPGDYEQLLMQRISSVLSQTNFALMPDYEFEHYHTDQEKLLRVHAAQCKKIHGYAASLHHYFRLIREELQKVNSQATGPQFFVGRPCIHHACALVILENESTTTLDVVKKAQELVELMSCETSPQYMKALLGSFPKMLGDVCFEEKENVEIEPAAKHGRC